MAVLSEALGLVCSKKRFLMRRLLGIATTGDACCDPRELLSSMHSTLPSDSDLPATPDGATSADEFRSAPAGVSSQSLGSDADFHSAWCTSFTSDGIAMRA